MEAEARVAGQLESIVLKRIASDRLVLPAMSTAAMAALNLLKDPNISNKHLSAALQRDPVLVLQLLKTANSAAYGNLQVTSLDQALSRLGTKRVKALLVETCARKLFVSRDNRIEHAFAQIWEHSLAVGILARDLASLNGKDGETAYVTGVLHDIGKPIVAGFLLEAERTLGRESWLDSEGWIGVVQRIHRPVGVAICEKWNLPADITAAVKECSDYDPGNRASTANFVRFANAIAKTHGLYVGKIDADDNEAILMIGRSLLGVDEDVVTRLTNGLKERVSGQSL
jgi:putative nucleotidyltransferase with HDIG domain